MTGTYLSTHGSGSRNETLPTEIPTVAERLSDTGYRTVGVSSNPYFSPMTGVDRGFDRFDFMNGVDLAREAGLKSMASFVRNVRRFSAGLELEKRKHDANFFVNEIVKDRLRHQADRDDPFFLAAHYPGAHHPYYPSPVFREAFAGDLSMSPKEAAELAFEWTTDVYSRIADGPIDTEAHRNALESMYDAQVAQIDVLVDGLIDYIDRLGIGDDTILVVTSDHGDLLGEMGLFSHKLVLHDALIRVPIAVRGSDYLAGCELGLAQHTDVMQTVLSELGADTAGMQGIRLDESVRDMAIAQRGPETYRKTINEVRKHDREFDHEHVLPGLVTAIRTDEWKYVSGDGQERLYELPFESESVATDNPEPVARLRTRLEEWMSDHDQSLTSDKSSDFDEDVQNLLADLGYVVD